MDRALQRVDTTSRVRRPKMEVPHRVGTPKVEMAYRRGMLRQERACKVGMPLLELGNEVYRCWESYFQQVRVLARALGWGF